MSALIVTASVLHPPARSRALSCLCHTPGVWHWEGPMAELLQTPLHHQTFLKASVDAKISFPANIQTKSKHTTEPWYQNSPCFRFRLERQFFMKVKTVPFYGLIQFWRHFFRNIIIMAKLCICGWASLWKQQYWLQS